MKGAAVGPFEHPSVAAEVAGRKDHAVVVALAPVIPSRPFDRHHIGPVEGEDDGEVGLALAHEY